LITPSEIFGNSLYLTFSQLTVRLLGLATTIALTHYLAPAEYGDLVLAYAYWRIFSTFVEAGVDLTVIREANQNLIRLGHFIGNSLLLRAFLAIVGYFLSVILPPFLGYGGAETRLFGIASLLILFSPLSIFRLVFLINMKIRLVAVLDVIGQLINTVLVFGIMFLQWNEIENVLLVRILATFLSLSFYIVCYNMMFDIKIPLRIDWKIWKTLLTRTWPLTISNTLHTVQVQASQLIVGRLLSNVDAGKYTMAMNLASTLSFVPAMYCTSIYPLLSRYYVASSKKFHQLYQFSFEAMTIIAIPLAFLASMFGDEIIVLYAGEAYLSIATFFVALLWMQVLEAANHVLYYTILAAGQQRFLLGTSILRTLIYLVLHTILLSQFGVTGSAFAWLVMYIVSFGIYGKIKATRGYVLDWLQLVIRPSVAFLISSLLLNISFLPKLVVFLSVILLYCVLLILMHNFNQDSVYSIDHILEYFDI
jgi:O-antigen/teichoic acid export membrane protein